MYLIGGMQVLLGAKVGVIPSAVLVDVGVDRGGKGRGAGLVASRFIAAIAVLETSQYPGVATCGRGRGVTNPGSTSICGLCAIVGSMIERKLKRSVRTGGVQNSSLIHL